VLQGSFLFFFFEYAFVVCVWHITPPFQTVCLVCCALRKRKVAFFSLFYITLFFFFLQRREKGIYIVLLLLSCCFACACSCSCCPKAVPYFLFPSFFLKGRREGGGDGESEKTQNIVNALPCCFSVCFFPLFLVLLLS
jgi:hypothetical protein